MVLAVDAGHQMKQKRVAWYMFATIIGGIIFVGSQAWEWKNFIKGTYGAVKTTDGRLLQFGSVDADGEPIFHQIALSDFVVGERTDGRVYTKEKTDCGLRKKKRLLRILLLKFRNLTKQIQMY